MSDLPYDPSEGERRRDEAHDRLRAWRAAYVRRGQRALLLRLLAAGTATADDVRAAIELPADLDPRCVGVVPIDLAAAGLIQAAGYQRSARPEAHARPVTVWTLADGAAAVAWLAAHPEIDPDM